MKFIFTSNNECYIILPYSFTAMGDIPEAPKLEPLILSSLSEDEVKWLNTWIETYSSSKQETQEKKEKEILFWRQPSLVNPKLFPFIEYPFVWDLEEHRKTDGSDYLRRKIFVTKESIDNIVVQCAIGCIKQDSLEEYFSSGLNLEKYEFIVLSFDIWFYF